MLLFSLMKKVTKKIKKIRFCAHCNPPSTDFLASARSSTIAFLYVKDLLNTSGSKLYREVQLELKDYRRVGLGMRKV